MRLKKVLSLLTAASLCATIVGSAISASALKYGEEWEGSRGETTVPTAAPAVPAAVPAVEGQTDAEPAAAAPAAPAVAGSFTDVPTTHWAYDAVERVKAQNWFSGYPDGTFHPDDPITRGEAVKVFVDFNSIPLSQPTSSKYTDLKLTAWYAPYVEAGAYLFPERTTPAGESIFQAEFPVTREDTIYAIVKALRYDQLVEFADQSVLNMFSDQNSITAKLKPYVAVAVSNHLASGYDDGTIGAQDPLTRAQFASLLYRAAQIGPLEDLDTNKLTTEIKIEPETYKEIYVGDSFDITARIYYSNGTDEDYSDKLNPYTEDQNYIVVTNRNKVTGNKEGTVIIKYNNDELRDRELVVNVVKNPADIEPEPEPTVAPTPEPPIPDEGEEEFGDEPVDVPTVPDEEKETGKAELAFIIDTTGSMGDEIANVRENLGEFAKYLETKGVDLNMSVVEYRDITCDGLDSTKVHYLGTSPWYKNASDLQSTLASLYVSGGGDYEETAIDGFSRILDNRYMKWSKTSYKFAVLLTDATYKTDNTYGYGSMAEVISKLKAGEINTSVITPRGIFSTYSDIASSTGGIQADIYSDFATVLNELADTIIERAGSTLAE